MTRRAEPALPPLATALAGLLERLEPEVPPGLLAATRLVVALESRGHTVLPLDDGDAGFVHGLADVTLRNWNGIEVGRLAADASLGLPTRRA